jgi:hypothetical protein
MVPGLAGDVQPTVDVAHLEHLIPEKTFSPSQDPDVTRILPSVSRVTTIVAFR